MSCSKDIKINEDNYFIFINMVKNYLENGENKTDKTLMLNYINYQIELRNLTNEKDLWFTFYKKNDSPQALERYKELKEKHMKIKEIDIWRYGQ